MAIYSCEEELRQFLAAQTPSLVGVSRPVRELLESIHDRPFDQTLSVQALKKRCRISDNNISCRFKHEVGVSIKEYVETLRLRAARHLLQRDETSAAEVAHNVGYAYLQTFYRAFKRRYHVCPGATRRTSRNGGVASSESCAQSGQRATLVAAMDRILPSDSGPGASIAHAADYTDWLSRQPAFAQVKGRLENGLALLDRLAIARTNRRFIDCDTEDKDAVLQLLAAVPHEPTREALWILIRLTLTGFLCDPRYSGNRRGIGWSYIGFTKSTPK
jgi:AraC-like DNA-binding protein